MPSSFDLCGTKSQCIGSLSERIVILKWLIIFLHFFLEGHITHLEDNKTTKQRPGYVLCALHCIASSLKLVASLQQMVLGQINITSLLITGNCWNKIWLITPPVCPLSLIQTWTLWNHEKVELFNWLSAPCSCCASTQRYYVQLPSQ